MKFMKKILATAAAVATMAGVVPAQAATYTNDFFDDSASAWGTDIEYIEDLGQYVIGGKSFYSSTDGVNWVRRAGGVANMKSQINAFAYGGSKNADEKYFLLIIHYNTVSETSNKTFKLDKYMSKSSAFYSYISDSDTDPDNDVPLILKGTLTWDDYTGKFWCGASKADGTYAGLYYSDGATTHLGGKQRMYWTKVDTGDAALYEEQTAYTTSPTTMVSVLANITTDGKGHIVAQPNWDDNKTSKFETQKTALGKTTCNAAIFVNAETENAYVAKTFSTLEDPTKTDVYTNQAYIGIDRYENIIFQQQSASNTAAIRTYTFDKAFANENGTVITGWGWIKEEQGRAFSNQKYGNGGGTIGKIVSLQDMLIMVPRAGYGASAGQFEDIMIATYDSENHSLEDDNNKFYTFINNADKVKEILATSAARHYVADAIGVGNKLVILTGRKTTAITTGLATGTSVVATIDLADAPTGVIPQTDEETSEPVYAGAEDRSDKVTVVSSTGTLGNKYSHINVAAEQTAIAAVRDDVFSLSAIAYDGLDAANPVEAENPGKITYTLISDETAFDGIFDFAGINDEGIYVWSEAPSGEYEITVEAAVDESPMIKNILTYTIKVPRDFTIMLNGNPYGTVDTGGYAQSGLVAGENTISVTANKNFGNSYYTVIAVYGEGGRLAACAISDPENNPGSVECTFNLAEEDLGSTVFRVLAWTTGMQPL